MQGQIETDDAIIGLNKALVNAGDKLNQIKSNNAAAGNNIDKKSGIYGLFVIIDEITKLQIWHISFYTLQLILPILAFLALHLWYTNVYDSGFDSGVLNFIRGISILLSFSEENTPGTLYLSAVIVNIVFIVVSLIVVFATLLYAKRKSTILKIMAIINAVALEIILPGFTIQLGHLIGVSVNGLLNSDASSIIVFFIGVILLILDFYFLNLTTSTLNYLTNPSQSIFTTFTGMHTKLFLIFNTIVAILCQLTSAFADWFAVVAAIISIVLNGYLFIDIFSCPFATLSGNALAAGLYVYAILGDILGLVMSFDVDLPGAVYVVIPFCGFVIGAIIVALIMKHKIHNITQLITLTEGQNAIEIYNELHIPTVNKGNTLMRYAFMGGSVSVLNGTFLLYLADRFNTYKQWLLSSEILALVPGEHDAFLRCYDIVKTLYTKSSIEKILGLRIIRIHQMRFATNDAVSSEVYQNMKVGTSEAVSAVRQFWEDIYNNKPVPLSDINGIGYLIYDMKKQWKETLNTYPNDPKFAELYSDFNIECTGKFEQGVFYQVKSSHLESGFHSGIDPIFRTFVISKPEMIHRRIVDKYGNVAAVMDGDMTLSMTLTTTRTGNQEEKLEEEIDAGIIEKRAAELFLWPKLRFTVTNITSKYTPPFFYFWTAIRLLAIIIVLVILIVCIVIFYVSFETSYMNTEQIGRVINMVESLAYLHVTTMLQSANATNQLYQLDHYESYLPAGAAKGESYYSMKYDNVQSDVGIWSQYGFQAYLDLFKAFADATSADVDMSKLISDLRDSNIKKVFCNGPKSAENEEEGSTQIAAKNAVISTLWNQLILTEDSFQAYQSDPTICETTIMESTLIPYLREMTVSLTTTSQNSVTTVSNRNKIILIIFIVFSLLSIIFSVAPIINMYLAQKRIFNALTTVNSANALQGSQPIKNNSKDEKYHSNVQKQISTYNTIFGIFTAIFVIAFILLFIFPIVTYSTINSKIKDISSIIGLTHFGSEREGYVIRILALVATQIIGIQARTQLGADADSSFWNIQSIRSQFDSEIEGLQEYNRYFQNGDNNNGMLNKLSAVRDLHVMDSCSNQVTSSAHDFYGCLGIDRAISSYVLYATTIMDDIESGQSYTLDNENFIDLHHFATTHLPSLLKQSRTETVNYIFDTIDNAKILVIVFIVISIICLFVAHIFISLINMFQKRTIKALLILIRHLPPPVIADSKEIIESLSLSEQTQKEEDLDPLEVIFNGISTPVLCIGENNVIEAANKPLLDTYKLTINEIVGRRLNAVIQTPSPNEQELTVEEQGALHLLEKLELMSKEVEVQHCSYRVNFDCNEQEVVLVQMTAIPIKNGAGKINFIIMTEDTRELMAIQHDLDILEKQTDILLNQLIPRTIASFVQGREGGFAFIGKTATIVAVRVTSAYELIQHSFEPLDDIYSQIDSIANRTPPYMPLKTIYDTLFYIGGLFTVNDTAGPPLAGIKLALEIKGYLENTLPKGDDRARFYISVITGGPLLCGLVGRVQLQFEISGPLIDEAATLLESAPPDMIIVAESTKVNASGTDCGDIKFDHQGTQALGMPTYLF